MSISHTKKSVFRYWKGLGKFIKTDTHTASSIRGKYARICLDIDLQKPLVPFFKLGSKRYVVDYEYIHDLCFYCGCVGHIEACCPTKVTQNLQHSRLKCFRLYKISQGIWKGSTSQTGWRRVGWLTRNPRYGSWMVILNRRSKKSFIKRNFGLWPTPKRICPPSP